MKAVVSRSGKPSPLPNASDLRKSETRVAQQLMRSLDASAGKIQHLTAEWSNDQEDTLSLDDMRHRETVAALLRCAQTVSAQRDNELVQAADGLSQLQQHDQNEQQLTAQEQEIEEEFCSLGELDEMLQEMAAARCVAMDQLQHTFTSHNSSVQLQSQASCTISHFPASPTAQLDESSDDETLPEAPATLAAVQESIAVGPEDPEEHPLITILRPESRVSKRVMHQRLTEAASRMESRMQARESAASKMATSYDAKVVRLQKELQEQHQHQLTTQLAAARSVGLAERRRAQASDVFGRVPTAQLSLLREAQRAQMPVSWHEGTQMTPRGFCDIEMQTEPDRDALTKAAFQKMDHCVLLLKYGAGIYQLLQLWSAETRKALAKDAVRHKARGREGRLAAKLWRMIVQREDQLRHSESLVHVLADGFSEMMGLHPLTPASIAVVAVILCTVYAK